MDKTLITHRLSKQDLLREMYNYFHNLFHDRTISAGETLNFLRYYLEYLFRANNIKTNDYIINLHMTNDRDLDGAAAYMIKGQKNNEYDVYLDKETMYTTRLVDSMYIARLIVIAGHEFKHCIQYINNDAGMADYFNKDSNIEKLMQKCKDKIKTKKRNTKEIILFDDLSKMHITEIDADKEGFTRCIALFDDLIEYIKDDHSTSYNLDMLREYVLDFKKARTREIKDARKNYRQQAKYFARHGEKLDTID